MRETLAAIWRLARICIADPAGRFGLFLMAVILALELGGVWISIRMIAWSTDFYNALERVDAAGVIAQIWLFAVLISLSAAQFLAADFLRKTLQIRWRGVLTGRTLDGWLSDHAYWHLRPELNAKGVENPDQRIADDCRLFVEGLLDQSIDLITRLVGLFSYVAVLWSLSTFPLAFTAWGADISIPHYMVWAAFLYVALCSLLTHWLGYPLKGLLFEQERHEADFRYALARLRESAGEVALAGGEPAERRLLDRRFAGIVGNWGRLIRREVVLGCFTRPYFQSVLRIPVFLALPVYLAGAVTLGGLMGLARAFTEVTTTLSWFIFNYRELANFVATAQRLDSIHGAIARQRDNRRSRPARLRRHNSPDRALRLSGVCLTTPDGRPLAPVPDITIAPGERIWISGPSGIGKSTLIAAIAGLWPYGAGEIALPRGRVAFLPQRPYMPYDGLAAAAAYPEDPEMCAPDAIEDALHQLGLEHRLRALREAGTGSLEGLSGGERQRLALARLLINRPDWIFLDEATSALDPAAHCELMALIDAALPDATFIVSSHTNPGRHYGRFRVLALGPPRNLTATTPGQSIPRASTLA